MMRYIFFVTGAQPWFKLAAALHDTNVATPVLWVGDPRHEPAARRRFGKGVVQSMDMLVHYPWRLRDAGYDGQNHEFFSSMEYYRAKDRALKMMDRLDHFGTFNRLDREVYFKNLCIWGLHRIATLKPDALIVVEAPHSHAQYTLFEICRYLKIPTFKIFPWTIVPAVALVSFDGTVHIGPDHTESNEVDARIRDGIKRYVQSVKATETGDAYEPGYMARQRLASSVFGLLSTYLSWGFIRMWLSRLYHRLRYMLRQEYAPIAPSAINLILSSFNVGARRRYLRKNYQRASVKPDLGGRYVYYGLHYEPERNTNPDGDEFHDQVLALIKLRDLLPDDVSIFVKEHPSQFMASMRGVRGRSPLFYESIKNISNLHVVDLSTSSMDLIRNALFVATITGTVALEAAILGKPAVAFGDAWYKNLPNVVRWRQDLSYDDIMSVPLRSSDDIVDHLCEDFRKNNIVACQNNSFEETFSSYVDERFREVEFSQLVQIFTKLSHRLNAAAVNGALDEQRRA